VMSVSIVSMAAAKTVVDWDALLDTGQTDAAKLLVAEPGGVVTIDWSSIISTLIYGVLGGLILFLGSVIVYVILKYAIPLLPALVQWLNDKRMLWLAKIMVNAAEVAFGRFTGGKKLDKVYEWLRKRNIIVSEDVQIMIDNAWQELNDKMIELGLKDAPTVDTEKANEPFSGSEGPAQME